MLASRSSVSQVLRLVVLAVTALTAGSATGGVVIGGNLPGTSLRPTAQRAIQIKAALRGVTWTNHNGRSVTRPHVGPLSGALLLTPPAGEWTDITLLFDGPVQLSDGQHDVTVDLDSLSMPLDYPVNAEDGPVWLSLDLVAPPDLFQSGPTLSVDHPAVRALIDGALAVVER